MIMPLKIKIYFHQQTIYFIIYLWRNLVLILAVKLRVNWNISSRLSRDEDVWALGPINHQTSFERRDETRWFATKHWDWGQMFLLDLKLDVPDVAWMANTNSLFFLKHSQIFVYSKLNLISRIFLETKLCIDERVVNAIIKRNQNLGQFLFAQLLI